MIFQEKCFSCYVLCNWPHFIVWLPLLLEILSNMCIAIVCLPGCDVINFEIKGPISGLRQFLVAESPWKMIKSTFDFILTALFVLAMFQFLFLIFGHVGKRLDKKAKFSKFMTSQYGSLKKSIKQWNLVSW